MSAIFDSQFLARLEQLHLLSRKIFRGQHRAERRSHRLGSSLEFADYRNYSHGDDLRSVDWNIYGRLDRLFVKQFEEEQDLHVWFLIDSSTSMRLAIDPARPTKFDHARRIAASLAYIALANLDRIHILLFDAGLVSDMGSSRGKSQFHKTLAFLDREPDTPAAPTNLRRSFELFARRMKRRGLVVLLSDFLDPAGFESPLSILRHQGFEIDLVQLLDPAEIDPSLAGDLKLLDAESGDAIQVTVTPGLMEAYRRRVRDHMTALDTFCLKRSIAAARVTTAEPFDEAVLRMLPNSRILR